jgi:hypothetical protein
MKRSDWLTNNLPQKPRQMSSEAASFIAKNKEKYSRMDAEAAADTLRTDALLAARRQEERMERLSRSVRSAGHGPIVSTLEAARMDSSEWQARYLNAMANAGGPFDRDNQVRPAATNQPFSESQLSNADGPDTPRQNDYAARVRRMRTAALSQEDREWLEG